MTNTIFRVDILWTGIERIKGVSQNKLFTDSFCFMLGMKHEK
jgi:hypothetical protein